MANSVDLTFIPIEESAKKFILEKEPTYYFEFLPAGTYKGMQEPVEAIFQNYSLFCAARLSDEFMYAATKAIFENLDYITSVNSAFKDTKIEKVYDGMSIPVHPGAEKYFTERGIKRKK